MTRQDVLRRISAAAVVAAAPFLGAAAPASAVGAGPSFDCSQASHPAELMICERPSLAKLDREISEVYFALLQALPPARGETLRQEQRDFLDYRNMCPSSAGLPTDCLENRLWERLAALRQLQAATTGAPLMTGGDVLAAPGVLWRAAAAGSVPEDATRLTNGAILCAVGLPAEPTIGTLGATGCSIARSGGAVEEPSFHVLISDGTDHGWARAASAGAPPEGAVAVWRDGRHEVMVCRQLLDGTQYVGTLTVGAACVVLFSHDEVEPVTEEIVSLAGFEVMTAPQ